MSDFKIVQLLNPIQLNLTGDINFTGEYNNSTAYNALDSVSYNGSSYVALSSTTGNTPTNTTYWQLLAEKGEDGAGVTDHGMLTGLSDDDHTQYHNDTRGDIRYYTKSQIDNLVIINSLIFG
jgi:hypothetical protein